MRVLFALAALSLSTTAFAGRCDIHNDTDQNFTIESGNVSNQRIEAHSQDSIESGDITGKSDSGKSIGGHCDDGQKIEIVEVNGSLVIRPQH